MSISGVCERLLEGQDAALSLRLSKVWIPNECPYHNYRSAWPQRVVRHFGFGDLFLDEVCAYRERQLAGADRLGIFPF